MLSRPLYTFGLTAYYPGKVLAAVSGMDPTSLSSLCSAAARCELSRNAWPHRVRSACAKESMVICAYP